MYKEICKKLGGTLIDFKTKSINVMDIRKSSKDSTRNSFVPEINIDVLQSNSQTTFKITVKPVDFVRVFIIFWYAFIIFFEVFSFMFSVL